MTPKEFKDHHGVHPSEIFGSNTTTARQNHAKNSSKPSKRVMNPKRVQKGSESQYDQLSEDQHQETLIKWLDAKKIYFEASINGMYLPNPHRKGSRAYLLQMRVNQKILSKHKKLGYRKGIADIKIYLPSIELNIELKKIGGKPTAEQLGNVERFKNYRYADYVIIEGFRDAIKYIEKYLI